MTTKKGAWFLMQNLNFHEQLVNAVTNKKTYPTTRFFRPLVRPVSLLTQASSIVFWPIGTYWNHTLHHYVYIRKPSKKEMVVDKRYIYNEVICQSKPRTSLGSLSPQWFAKPKTKLDTIPQANITSEHRPCQEEIHLPKNDVQGRFG